MEISLATAELIATIWFQQYYVNSGRDIIRLIAQFAKRRRRGFDRFTLKKLMGHTQQGCVFLAHDYYNPGCPVVVKMALKVLVDSSRNRQMRDCQERFLEEIRIHELLTRTTGALRGHMPRFLQAWHDDCSYYMAMEFCAEQTLLGFVKSRAPTLRGEPAWLRRVRGLFQQLVRAVKAMHGAGVCHNDLRLGNAMVMLSADGRATIYIIDFGVADRFDAPPALPWMSARRTGHARYMSPKMWQGPLAGADSRGNDVWALVAMLFAMLTGEFLYDVPDPDRDPDLFHAMRRPQGMQHVLRHRQLLDYVPEDALHLMDMVFGAEDPDRVRIDDLLHHPYVAQGDALVEVEVKEQERGDLRQSADLVHFSSQGDVVDDLQTDLAYAHKYVKVLASQKTRLEEQLNQSTQRMQALSGEVSRLEHESAAQKETIWALEGTVSSLQEAQEASQQELEAKDAEIAALKKQLAQQMQEVSGVALKLALQADERKKEAKAQVKLPVRAPLEQSEARDKTTYEEEVAEDAPGFHNHHYFNQLRPGEGATGGAAVDALPPDDGALVPHVRARAHSGHAPWAAAPDHVGKPRARSF